MVREPPCHILFSLHSVHSFNPLMHIFVENGEKKMFNDDLMCEPEVDLFEVGFQL